MRFAIPVLNYHSANIAGSDYANNDHVAFRADLDLLTGAGWTIRPLHSLLQKTILGREAPPARAIALTFDDGTDFDFVDLVHPNHGLQRSLYNILRDHRAAVGSRQPEPHATAFVVVSPDARAELDRRSMIGAGWWNDAWWQTAIASGLIGIANHSWDHNHPLVSEPVPTPRTRGTFASIDDFAAAEAEIARGAEYIRRVATNPAERLFAYPYGEANAFLAEEYFPEHGARIGVDAAFTSACAPMTEASDRWRLPRLTCGQHWKSQDELRSLLRDFAA